VTENPPIRTRFAPSPTGYLHIGGVRSALFNWLFSRRHGGKFILRIDDTDQQRNVEAALAPILHGFRWLGLDWDEGPEVEGPFAPYFQSQRHARYQAAVERLLAGGHAYYDYATSEEMDAQRKAAEREKRQFQYDRRFMAVTPEERSRFESEGRKWVVRLKMPRTGTLKLRDLVRGSVDFEWAQEADHVVQRSDGSFIYHLASVVDDHDFGVTHVIRAEEHLSNTPRQIFALEGLGYPRPIYAHVPFVAEPGSKNKLSKRKIAQYLKNPDFKKVYEHGQAIAARLGLAVAAESFNPVLVEFYEQVGYLPHALVNYLMLLGWAHEDGKSEIFNRQQMIELFTLERVNKAPASFDPKKLFAFQERYFQELPVEEKVKQSLPFLVRAGLVPEPVPAECRATLSRIVTEAGPRMIVAGDILNYDDFFLPDDRLPCDDRAFDKYVRQAPDLLRKLRELVAAVEPFDTATLRRRVEELAQAGGGKPGALSQSLRVAVTGKQVGFDAYATLAILGRDRCLRRIDRALGRL
jgi:glutamyl-tRNA synthetase